MKNHVITISGNIASGKSEVAGMLADELKYELYKASDIFRAKAREYNMSLVDFNEYTKKNPEVDKHVDNSTREKIKNKENIVLDARLGFFVAKNAFNIFLKVDIDKAATRLYLVAKNRGKEEEYNSVDSAKEGIKLREAAERKRYIQLYNVDIAENSNYSLIVDTSNITSKEVVNIILEEYTKWLKD